MKSTSEQLATTAGRTMLISLSIAAGVGALLTFITGALHLSKSIGTNYGFNVFVATPLDQRPDLVPSAGTADIQFDQVSVVPSEHPLGAQLLESVAVGSRYAVGLLACLVVVVFCIRLLLRRPFSGWLSWLLAGLALLMCLVALAAPWLDAQAVVTAVDHVGLPTSADRAGLSLDRATWVVPPAYTLQDTDWSLLALGLICGLCAALLARGHRMQTDTEGLV